MSSASNSPFRLTICRRYTRLQTQVESFLRSTVGADVVRGVSLAPRCTLTGMNSFAGGAVLEIVCYNDYAAFRNAALTMRLRHHIFLGLSRIFESTGVKFAIAGSIPSGEYLSELLDTSKPLGGWEASARLGKEVARRRAPSIPSTIAPPRAISAPPRGSESTVFAASTAF